MTKNSEIKKEKERLELLFKEIPEDKRILSQQLIDNASFMAVTLKELQKDINKDGTTEVYKNGENQRGKHMASSLQAYNKTISSYVSVIKTLNSLLPEQNISNINPMEAFLSD